MQPKRLTRFKSSSAPKPQTLLLSLLTRGGFSLYRVSDKLKSLVELFSITNLQMSIHAHRKGENAGDNHTIVGFLKQMIYTENKV